MLNGEAKALEMESAVFPINYDLDDVEIKLPDEKPALPLTKESRFNNFDINVRFARLKKNVKKKSANIL